MIFHLTVIIVLLLYQIDATVRREESFVIDFSKQEEIERQLQEIEEMEREIAKMDAIRQRLEEKISGTASPVKNIAVDRGAHSKTTEELMQSSSTRMLRDWPRNLGTARATRSTTATMTTP